MTHNLKKKPTSSQHSIFSTTKIQSLNTMCLFRKFFVLIYLIKSKLVTEAKLGLLFRLSLCFVQDGSHDPANSSYSSALKMFSKVHEVNFLCIESLHKYIDFSWESMKSSLPHYAGHQDDHLRFVRC